MNSRRSLSLTIFAVLGIAIVVRSLPGNEKPKGPERWEADIRKFEQQDRETPPTKGGILFVGSSSIRFWKLGQHFPELQPLNRGFGGSEVADSVHFADRIVLPYEPRTIVMYAGDNDIAGGKTPEEVHHDFERFVGIVHENLPETKIVYIAIKPSIKRWKLVDRMRAANALICATCDENDRLEFVDIDTPMIGDDGEPRQELFIEDGLHLSEEGYRLWSKLVMPHLVDSTS
ncbi:MAG: hypothetical protein KDA93_11470 [Planctomycetaceae bacterium]|nr:hypothetical protein [Planctomycetaceae bacterium]